jgi:endonuclease/exonuclease/phosphatase (EEP) superfamily protein YafD
MRVAIGWLRSHGWSAGCWLLVMPGAILALVRVLGLERGPLVQLLAFTPYAAAAALLPLAIALLARRWGPAAVAAMAVLAFAVAVVPRVVPDGAAPPPTGPVVRILTANLRFGGVDPEAVVELVHDQRVDALALQELTGDAARGLAQAGLGHDLPYREVHPEGGASGSAIYSRFPLTHGGVRVNPGGFWQAYATMAVPGGPPLMVESVHPCAPFGLNQLDCWRADLAGQPPATPDGPVRVLAGDFNATLDHAALRRLIGTGYRDAAASVGTGLTPTWGAYGGRKVPPVTLDRVLADERIGVRDVSVHPLPESDHRAVVAELVLPPDLAG